MSLLGSEVSFRLKKSWNFFREFSPEEKKGVRTMEDEDCYRDDLHFDPLSESSFRLMGCNR